VISRPPGADDVAGLACPACCSGLDAGESALVCEGCRRSFQIVAGIPDLRLGYPDRYVSREEDLQQAIELEGRYDELDFAGLLREHWRRSGKPRELTERFVAGDLASLQRSRRYVEEIERELGSELGEDDRFLEVGCGSAGLSAAAARRAGEVVATDVSLRWMILAKKRLAELGGERVRLVCCQAEHPPFVDGHFDVVAASDVIEHVASQDGFAEGSGRVLRPGGLLFLATPNRFSISLEPHVRLWGVGFMPRPLAKRYVAAVRKVPYDHVRPLSARGLRRVLARHGFRVRVVSPEIPAATVSMYRGPELRLVHAYNRVRRLQPVRRALLAIGPFFHVFAIKKGTSNDFARDMETERDLARDVAAIRWYHTIDLPGGIVTPGRYDTRPALMRLPFPESLSGKRCLDIGTANGFWAFEMERRGAAEVVAIDIADPDMLDWPEDVPQEDRDRVLRVTEAFELAAHALDSGVQRVFVSIYDLSAEELGEFDFVFLGSLLLHLRDPIRALSAVRDITRGRLLVNDFVSPSLSLMHRFPTAELHGVGDIKWWVVNTAGLGRLVEASGFEVERLGRPYLLTYGRGRVRPAGGALSRARKMGARRLARGAVLRFGVPHAWVLARPRLRKER
jgi:tRNA (mo5U34)-methyltransferase